MTKNRIPLAIALGLLIILGPVLYFRYAHTKSATLTHICITQIATNPGIDAVRTGFVEELTHLGYVEGKNVLYDESNAQGDMASVQSIAQRLAADRCNLIFAISTPSSQAIAQAIRGTSTPLIFGAVTDPVAAGLAQSLGILVEILQAQVTSGRLQINSSFFSAWSPMSSALV
jgi:ABC-type uncharacterized transport system substrate-binding protein